VLVAIRDIWQAFSVGSLVVLQAFLVHVSVLTPMGAAEDMA
jgi:hypothetical protein